MRINCAHDDGAWSNMVANLQRAKEELGREHHSMSLSHSE
jgi:hypothetical protein